MIPNVMNGMGLNYEEILWIPCLTDFDEAGSLQDRKLGDPGLPREGVGV